MRQNTPRFLAPITVVLAVALGAAACGDSTDETSGPPPTSTTAPATADWQAEVTEACAAAAEPASAITPNDGTPAGIGAEATATKAVYEGSWFDGIEVPDDQQVTLEEVATYRTEAIDHLDASIELATSGDTVAAQRELDEGFDRLARTATAWAIAGATCGPAEAVRARNADLTVPLAMFSWQITSGFDSIWVSERLAHRVVRLDPDTGEVLAAIDVGAEVFKAQPAADLLWVRTATSYVAIDPATDSITQRLEKAAVGPQANRSWATGDALRICDGRHLHRYDARTATAITTVDLDIDCVSVFATDELVVAWSYDEEPGESGNSAAAVVDPTSNIVLATVSLPVDVMGPAITPTSLVFPGYGGSVAAVVDRGNWAVTQTPDLGVAGGGAGQAEYDGESIYIVSDDEMRVVRVDAESLEVVETFEPLGVNGMVVVDGALWTAKGQPVDAVQRFAISG